MRDCLLGSYIYGAYCFEGERAQKHRERDSCAFFALLKDLKTESSSAGLDWKIALTENFKTY